MIRQQRAFYKNPFNLDENGHGGEKRSFQIHDLFSKNLDYNGDAQIKVSIPDLAPGIYNASLNSNSKHFNSKILVTN